jgi:hypothetical protein
MTEPHFLRCPPALLPAALPEVEETASKAKKRTKQAKMLGLGAPAAAILHRSTVSLRARCARQSRSRGRRRPLPLRPFLEAPLC